MPRVQRRSGLAQAWFQACKSNMYNYRAGLGSRASKSKTLAKERNCSKHCTTLRCKVWKPRPIVMYQRSSLVTRRVRRHRRPTTNYNNSQQSTQLLMYPKSPRQASGKSIVSLSTGGTPRTRSSWTRKSLSRRRFSMVSRVRHQARSQTLASLSISTARMRELALRDLRAQHSRRPSRRTKPPNCFHRRAREARVRK